MNCLKGIVWKFVGSRSKLSVDIDKYEGRRITQEKAMRLKTEENKKE